VNVTTVLERGPLVGGEVGVDADAFRVDGCGQSVDHADADGVVAFAPNLELQCRQREGVEVQSFADRHPVTGGVHSMVAIPAG